METAGGHTKPIMLQALNETTIAHVSEINALIKELEELKTHLIQSADRCKDQVARHFDVAMEASGFIDVIKQRLADRINNPSTVHEPGGVTEINET